MSGRWRVAGASDVGMQRTRNEDGWAVVPPPPDGPDRWLLIVCDGMGGHADGDRASATAVALLRERIPVPGGEEPYLVLHQALVDADRAVVAAAQGSDMGTTAVLAWLDGDKVWYGWVGDSRLYVLRGGRVTERTEDHTRVASLVASGQLTDAEAREHPDAHMLQQALGIGSVRPSVYTDPLELSPGDAVLLCSDGMHDLITDDEIPALLQGLPPEQVVRRLIDLSNARGGHDNITVVMALLEDPEGSAPASAARHTVSDEAAPTAAGRMTTPSQPAPGPSLLPRSTPPSWWLLLLGGVLIFVVGLAAGRCGSSEPAEVAIDGE